MRAAARLGALVLRADADSEIGYGHLMRSFALAEAWCDLGGVARMVTSCPALPAPLRMDPRIAVVELERHHPDPGDIRSVTRVLAAEPAEWVSCDGYHLDPGYVDAIRSAGHRVLRIEDGVRADAYAVDALLDQNLGASERPYRLPTSALRLFGPRYALIRRAFRATGRTRSHPQHVRSALLLAGAGDGPGHTLRWMRALSCVEGLAVDVVVGAVSPHLRDAERLARELGPERFRVRRDPEDLPALMAGADMAISAAGTTSWELCATGVPMILLAVAENQLVVAEGLAKAGAARYLGRVESVSDEVLASAVASVAADRAGREALSARARELVDGSGAVRAAEALHAAARGTT